MLDAKSLFDESFYDAANADVAAAIAKGTFQSGYDHFTQFGKLEGRAPSAFFDPSVYLAQNTDVAQAVQNKTFASAFDHFIQYGQKEIRAASTIFDDAYYLRNQLDVATAVNKDQLTGIEHFVKYGLNEGRAGSKGFNVTYYLNSNADLKAAGFNKLQALDHFMTKGVDEGRKPTQAFDPRYYLNSNPDLQAAKLTNRQAFEHMMIYGSKEKRVGTAGTLGGYQIYKAPRLDTSIPISSFFPVSNPPVPGLSSSSLLTPVDNPSNGNIGNDNPPNDPLLSIPASPATGTQTLQQKFYLYNDTPFNMTNVILRTERLTAEDIAKGAVPGDFSWVITPPDSNTRSVGSASDIYKQITVKPVGNESELTLSGGIIAPGEGFIVLRDFGNQTAPSFRFYRATTYGAVS